MRKAVAAVAVVAASTVAALAGNNGQDFAQIERGRYLAAAGDCAGCHTAVGGADFAGGMAIETPFGKVVAANITPDRETGIGAWSDDDFVRALTEGVARDGTHLYPAMPYPYYTKVSRGDVLAIRAYLTTVPAVHNPVTSDQLPFPLNQRADMAVWNKLYFHSGEYRPVAGKSAVWNRGGYLVEGLMHCGACHTPKNTAGGDYLDRPLKGYALQGWFAPDISGDTRRGIGSWSADDLVTYLKTGHNRFAAATGPMADVVAKSSSKLTDADLRDVATYLKDQPGLEGEEEAAQASPVDAGNSQMQAGAAIYTDECSACHTPKGTGVLNLFPSLAGAPSVQSADPTSLIRVVLGGTRSVATDQAPTGPAMPAFAWLLDDRRAAAVLTYIRNSWGNAAAAVTAAQVQSERADLAKRTE
ncbi:MAG TPA: cytochrome c [Stellaceae bacterium]|nr:cytochrome c [Stellaceae bacterium]